MSPGHFCSTDNVIVDIVLYRLHRLPDGIADGFDGGTAVGDDGDAVHPEKKGTAVLLVVGLLFDGAESGSGQPSPQHADRRFFNLVLQPLKNGVGDAFSSFEDDVADEPVADHDLDRIFKEIPALNVAGEMDRGAG